MKRKYDFFEESFAKYCFKGAEKKNENFKIENLKFRSF